MFNKSILLITLTSLITFSCIKDDILDDFVPPQVNVINKITSITNGLSYTFEATYSNDIGDKEDVSIIWSSSNSSVASITENGTVTGIKNGETTIKASYQDYFEEFTLKVEEFTITNSGDTIADSNDTIIVTLPTIRTGTLITTSSYILSGTFMLEENNGELTLTLNSDFKGDAALPGLTMYLTNNPSTNNGAYELGGVTDHNGENVYIIPASEGISISDYSHVLGFCKPFTVKVGDGSFDN